MTVKATWTKEGCEFLAQVRLSVEQRAAGPDSLVGRWAWVVSKARDGRQCQLTEVVRDYGAGDVTLYRVQS